MIIINQYTRPATTTTKTMSVFYSMRKDIRNGEMIEKKNSKKGRGVGRREGTEPRRGELLFL
jgi:hypothetical protein